MQTFRRSIRHDLGLSIRDERSLHLRLKYSPPLSDAGEEWEHIEITGD